MGNAKRSSTAGAPAGLRLGTLPSLYQRLAGVAEADFHDLLDVKARRRPAYFAPADRENDSAC